MVMVMPELQCLLTSLVNHSCLGGGHHHFSEPTGLITKCMDKCPSTVTKVFNCTVHPYCSSEYLLQCRYTSCINLCSSLGSLTTNSSELSMVGQSDWLLIHFSLHLSLLILCPNIGTLVLLRG